MSALIFFILLTEKLVIPDQSSPFIVLDKSSPSIQFLAKKMIASRVKAENDNYS
jgi:hypothetical protein